ncbi:HalOD1 output domain-containing protein [Haloarcula litorea]|uniref:HalOD1 output domain-containing protein n=1 Tax=Haloarcula litorea TaxID=3032579 RepID=UPI0023E88CC4|nr:HalOD1 output domain-containing protein [Halomicroarcula sp. GDY20]
MTTAVSIPLEDAKPAQAIIEAVAAASNTPPDELPSLHAVVDPDALNQLLNSESDVEVSFDYAGYRVHASTEEVTVLADVVVGEWCESGMDCRIERTDTGLRGLVKPPECTEHLVDKVDDHVPGETYRDGEWIAWESEDEVSANDVRDETAEVARRLGQHIISQQSECNGN